MKQDDLGNDDVKMNPEDGLNQAQLDQIEKEVIKKLKKDRTLDGGVRHIKEKAAFTF